MLTAGLTGTLFCPENRDDRVVIVWQRLSRLELPEKYAQLCSSHKNVCRACDDLLRSRGVAGTALSGHLLQRKL